MSTNREPLLGTVLVLGAVNLAAAVAAPLVAAMALRNGDPGMTGWLYPVLAFAAVLSSSLVMIGERLSGRPAAWWPRLVLGLALALSVWAVIAEAVTW